MRTPSRVLNGLVVVLLTATLGAWGGGGALAMQEAGPAFDALYQATDGAPGWPGPRLWGELLEERAEAYQEGPEGERTTRYYAKGRMELTRPEAGASGVTTGRLVHELMGGALAVGDSRSLRYAGADIPVVGDRDRRLNPAAPTYRSLRALQGPSASAVGQPVDMVLLPPEGSGFMSLVLAARRDPALGQLASNTVYLADVGHNIPDVFWEVLTAQGAPGGRTLTWTALYGWPLTDAFWVSARQDSRPVDALVQLFERRTLVYLPAAPAGQRVMNGDVGRDYLTWRYGLSNAAPNLTPPPSENGQAIPPVGEAGTTFLLRGGGFAGDEPVDAWLEALGVISPVTLRLTKDGSFAGTIRTQPLLTPALEGRLVVQGRESGRRSVIQFRILATDQLTPGAEAAEPETVPPGRGAHVTPTLLPVGQVGDLQAVGFAPNEPITAWITTGLNRVVPYVTHIATTRLAPNVERPRLVTAPLANADGQVAIRLPAPGLAVPGIYAITLVGRESGVQTIAYFRARAGDLSATNLLYSGMASDPFERPMSEWRQTALPTLEPIDE